MTWILHGRSTRGAHGAKPDGDPGAPYCTRAPAHHRIPAGCAGWCATTGRARCSSSPCCSRLLSMLGGGARAGAEVTTGTKKVAWVDQKVSFPAGGLIIYGTFRHPTSGRSVPGVLLIAGSGPTDRNGNNAQLSRADRHAEDPGRLAVDRRGRLASLRQVGEREDGIGPLRLQPRCHRDRTLRAGGRGRARLPRGAKGRRGQSPGRVRPQRGCALRAPLGHRKRWDGATHSRPRPPRAAARALPHPRRAAVRRSDRSREVEPLDQRKQSEPSRDPAEQHHRRAARHRHRAGLPSRWHRRRPQPDERHLHEPDQSSTPPPWRPSCLARRRCWSAAATPTPPSAVPRWPIYGRGWPRRTPRSTTSACTTSTMCSRSTHRGRGTTSRSRCRSPRSSRQPWLSSFTATCRPPRG